MIATLQLFNSYIWLGATILDNTDIEHLYLSNTKLVNL